jgi:hypothetical protein
VPISLASSLLRWLNGIKFSEPILLTFLEYFS